MRTLATAFRRFGRLCWLETPESERRAFIALWDDQNPQHCRIAMLLLRSDITTVRQLRSMTDQQLLALRNFGHRALTTVRQLVPYDPTLAPEPEPINVMVHLSCVVAVDQFPVPDDEMDHLLAGVIGVLAALLSDGGSRVAIDKVELDA